MKRSVEVAPRSYESDLPEQWITKWHEHSQLKQCYRTQYTSAEYPLLPAAAVFPLLNKILISILLFEDHTHCKKGEASGVLQWAKWRALLHSLTFTERINTYDVYFFTSSLITASFIPSAQSWEPLIVPLCILCRRRWISRLSTINPVISVWSYIWS